MPSLPTVPGEITDYILDFLHDDGTTLAACALVCKDFLHTSRMHFFKNTEVNNGNYIHFLDLLDSPHCTIASSVSHLRLREISHCGLAVALVPRLNTLSALQSLSLSFIRWGDVCTPEKTKLLSSLTGVTDLALTGGRSFWPSRIVEFICAFPSLTKLHIDTIHWPSDLPIQRPHIHPPSSFRILHFENCYFDPVVRWLVSLEPTPSLHTLRVHPVSLMELPAIGRLVRLLGASLHTLQLGLVSGTRLSEDILRNHVNLSNNTNLRSLCLDYDHMYEHRDPTRNESLGGHIPALLSQITSQSITEIRLRCEPIVMEVLNEEVWADMTCILERQVFWSLRRLVFVSIGPPYPEKTVALVRAHLPGCEKRGILYFG